jgi:hypothetical protein
MNWDFWRIDWPNAAAIFALAILPVFAALVHMASEERQPPIQVAAASPTAITVDVNNPP